MSEHIATNLATKKMPLYSTGTNCGISSSDYFEHCSATVHLDIFYRSACYSIVHKLGSVYVFNSLDVFRIHLRAKYTKYPRTCMAVIIY